MILLSNVFYRNGGIGAAGATDVGNAAPAPDGAVADNATTSGLEGSGIAGCAVPGCAPWPFTAIFVGSGYGPSFRLAAGSPAVARGRVTFTRDGREWIPVTDLDGRPRGGATRASAVDVGCDQFE
jgi:hypothetical protein